MTACTPYIHLSKLSPLLVHCNQFFMCSHAKCLFNLTTNILHVIERRFMLKAITIDKCVVYTRVKDMGIDEK